MLRLFFIVECGIVRFLCVMRVFEVLASSLSPRLPLCQILLLLRPPLLNYHMKKNRVLNHSPSLVDLMPREPKCLCFWIKDKSFLRFVKFLLRNKNVEFHGMIYYEWATNGKLLSLLQSERLS